MINGSGFGFRGNKRQDDNVMLLLITSRPMRMVICRRTNPFNGRCWSATSPFCLLDTDLSAVTCHLTNGRGQNEYLPYKKSDTTHYSQ